MRYTCGWCEAEFFREPGRGRTPRTCSPRCRKALSRSRPRLPKALTDLRRWTARVGKRPVTVAGLPASSTDASTWSSFRSVCAGPHGVMLGDGLACLDLDDCLDGGQLKGWAVDAVGQIAPEDVIWVERSMSGRGVHVFYVAPESPGRRRRMPDGGSVEWYSKGRFIAVTGDRFDV